MLAIRMQRVGRKGHPEYRVVVQDARLTPSSGRIVARVGHYNPHTKQTTLDKEKVEYYLTNGAKPSPRVVGILVQEKVALPTWVETPSNDKKRSIRNAEKLRRNQPQQEVVETEPTETQTDADSANDSSAVEAEASAEEAPTQE